MNSSIEYLKDIISGRKFNSMESEELLKEIVENNFNSDYTAVVGCTRS